MTLPKVWTSNEVLTFTDLNGNFSFLEGLLDLQPVVAASLADRITDLETIQQGEIVALQDAVTALALRVTALEGA